MDFQRADVEKVTEAIFRNTDWDHRYYRNLKTEEARRQCARKNADHCIAALSLELLNAPANVLGILMARGCIGGDTGYADGDGSQSRAAATEYASNPEYRDACGFIEDVIDIVDRLLDRDSQKLIVDVLESDPQHFYAY